MTVESQTTRKKYSGTSSPVADYPVTFTFIGESDLEVIFADENETETVLELNTHYTVSGGDGSTGTVSVSDADYRPATGESLTIRMAMTLEQQTDLVDGAALSASVLESQFDRSVRMIQQQQEELGRCVKVQATSDIDPDALLTELAADALLASESASAAAASADAAGSSQTAAGEAQVAAEAAQEAAEAARDAIPAAGDILTVDDVDEVGGVQSYDPDILKADESKTTTKGYPSTPAAMATAAPTPATAGLQTIDTSGGAVTIGVPTAAGVIRFIVSGSNALNPSASYDSIDGEYDTSIGLAQGEIVSDGTHHFLTIVNAEA